MGSHEIISLPTQAKVRMSVSRPEFNEKTTATEVVGAFADQIKGKNGKSVEPLNFQVTLKYTNI